MKQQINLYHPMFRKQEKVFSAMTMAQITGFILVVLAVMYGYSLWSIQPLEHELAKADTGKQRLQQELVRVQEREPAHVKSQLLEDEIRRLNAELQQKRRLKNLLADDTFGNREGFSAMLESFARQHVNGLWLTHISLNRGGTELQLRGKAKAAELVPLYIQRLATEASFANMSFSVLEMNRIDDQEDVIEFNLASRIVANQGG